VEWNSLAQQLLVGSGLQAQIQNLAADLGMEAIVVPLYQEDIQLVGPQFALLRHLQVGSRNVELDGAPIRSGSRIGAESDFVGIFRLPNRAAEAILEGFRALRVQVAG